MSKEGCIALVVLGRGIDPRTGAPSVATVQRAETAADYYEAYPGRVERIVCSGRYSRSITSSPPNGATEGGHQADTLIRRGVPSRKIYVDNESGSTLGNFIASAALLEGFEFNPDNPLGLVLGGGQGMRAGMAGRQAYGLNRRSLRRIHSPGEASVTGFVTEAVGACVTYMALIGSESGNLVDTVATDARLEAMTSWARVLSGLRGE